MTNNYQNSTTRASDGRGLAVPEAVTIAMAGSPRTLREGLLARTVGTGLQVMAAMMDADVAACAVPRASPSR